MSLATLRSLRIDGHRPELLTVFIGRPPSEVDAERPDVVVIEKPFTDLRPLVACPAIVIELRPNNALFDRVMGELTDLGIEVRGMCCDAGVVGINERAEKALVRYRERLLLCME